jgi:hypothetical protein
VAEFCSISDLTEERADIYGLMSEDDAALTLKIEEAGLILDRDLKAKWFRPTYPDAEALGIVYSRDDLELSELKRSGIFLTLSESFRFLAQDAGDDIRHGLAEYYRGLYEDELAKAIAAGLTYSASQTEPIQTGGGFRMGYKMLVRA